MTFKRTISIAQTSQSSNQKGLKKDQWYEIEKMDIHYSFNKFKGLKEEKDFLKID